MAKMFYTLDEARAALGKSEDEIKAYAREGRLREFRDGPRLMFKADQVEQLKTELSGDNVDLGVSDSGGLIGLVDTTGASGTSVTISDDVGQSSGGLRTKEDTALAADLGLSGAAGGGMPSPSRAGTGLSGTAAGSRAGINVFGDDSEIVDPSAQTAITGGLREQINLEGVGSGSGLLDLTRESDDTSLGAVLDNLGPGIGGRAPMDMMETSAMLQEEAEEEEVEPVRQIAAPVYVTKPDPLAPAFGGLALGAAICLLAAIYVLVSAMAGSWNDFTRYFDKDKQMFPLYYGLGICVLLFVFGLLIGKLTAASNKT